MTLQETENCREFLTLNLIIAEMNLAYATCSNNWELRCQTIQFYKMLNDLSEVILKDMCL